jgi:hypothetical protein
VGDGKAIAIIAKRVSPATGWVSDLEKPVETILEFEM